MLLICHQEEPENFCDYGCFIPFLLVRFPSCRCACAHMKAHLEIFTLFMHNNMLTRLYIQQAWIKYLYFLITSLWLWILVISSLIAYISCIEMWRTSMRLFQPRIDIAHLRISHWHQEFRCKRDALLSVKSMAIGHGKGRGKRSINEWNKCRGWNQHVPDMEKPSHVQANCHKLHQFQGSC